MRANLPQWRVITHWFYLVELARDYVKPGCVVNRVDAIILLIGKIYRSSIKLVCLQLWPKLLCASNLCKRDF